MTVKKLFGSNPFLDTFKLLFVGVLGAASAKMILGLYSVIFVGIGYFIIMKYNKENTKPFKEIQTPQYVGIVIAILGLLPWIQYFFMAFMLEGGKFAFGEMLGE
jgi:hypothetical protein